MNAKIPLVSICIPTYNRAKLVQCAIASAQAQTYPNIEIIVTDNCSTDNTEEVVRAIAAKDPRVRYIRNETNVGPTRNWQVAVDAAKGEYCKILFSDDMIAPEFVSACVDQFKKGTDVAFVVTDGIAGKSFDNGNAWHASCQPEGISRSRDYILDYLMWRGGADSPACALFLTKDVAAKIVTENPYFEIDKYAQNGAGSDCLIFLNAALSHTEFAYIAKPLTFFRSEGDSISYIAASNSDSLLALFNCYAKARYQFLRKIANSHCRWYLCFLSTIYGAVRKRHVRKLLAHDFKLKENLRFTIIDFAIGCMLRQYKDRLVQPRLARILSAINAN